MHCFTVISFTMSCFKLVKNMKGMCIWNIKFSYTKICLHPNDFHFIFSRTDGVMISVLATRAVYLGFRHWSGQTLDYKISICCFSPYHAALSGKNIDWLAWNQDNVSRVEHMSTRGLLFQWASTIKIQLSMLV
jgi:hypothetical protein